ncbi:MAG: YbjN domain-containing protein [Ignavibacteria bacterium]|nr:YbjN domain-containing protein [Ignavibacteria bacterium]
MSSKYELVKNYLINLGYHISREIPEEEIVIVDDTDKGISNLIIDCENPLLIFEQYIGKLKKDEKDVYKKLLQVNRKLVHGAFVLEEVNNTLLFRDTLQLENLDENEVEGTMSSIHFAMAEHTDFLIEICK